MRFCDIKGYAAIAEVSFVSEEPLSEAPSNEVKLSSGSSRKADFICSSPRLRK